MQRQICKRNVEMCFPNTAEAIQIFFLSPHIQIEWIAFYVVSLLPLRWSTKLFWWNVFFVVALQGLIMVPVMMILHCLKWNDLSSSSLDMNKMAELRDGWLHTLLGTLCEISTYCLAVFRLWNIKADLRTTGARWKHWRVKRNWFSFIFIANFSLFV